MAGSLTGVDIAGVLTGSAGFAVTKESVTVNDGVAPPVDAVLVAVQLTSPDLRIGTADVYARVTAGTLNVYSVAPTVPTGHSWLAVDAAHLGGVLHLGTLASATLAEVVVQLNRANSPELDWSHVIGETITLPSFSGPLTHISGSLQSLVIGGFVRGNADFDLTKRLVDVQLAPGDVLANAFLFTLGLTNLDLTVGDLSGVHLGVHDGSLAAGVVQAPAPGDRHRRPHVAHVRGTAGTITFAGVPGLDFGMTLDNLSVSLNVATGTNSSSGTAAAPLDWTTALDLDGNGHFHEVGFNPATDELTVGGTLLNLTGSLVQAAGAATIHAFGFVDGTVNFVFKRETVNIDGNHDGLIDAFSPSSPPARGPPDLANATLTTLGLSVLSDATHAGLTIGVPNGAHLTVTAGRLALAIVTPSATDQAAGDGRSWLALTSSIDSASLTGITGFAAYGSDIVVELNQASGLYDPTGLAAPAEALNWSNAVVGHAGGVQVDTDPAGSAHLTLSFANELIDASATLGIDIGGFVSAAGTAHVSKRSVTGGGLSGTQTALRLRSPALRSLSVSAGR